MEWTRQETMITFAIALAVLYLVFWVWHSPWAGKLTKAEIDRYLAIMETRLLPAEASIPAMVSSIRRKVGNGA